MIRSPVPPRGPSQGAAGPELTLSSQLPRHGAQAVASSPLAESLHTALLLSIFLLKFAGIFSAFIFVPILNVFIPFLL